MPLGTRDWQLKYFVSCILYISVPGRGRPAGPVLCPGGLCGAGGLLHGLSPVRPHPVGPQVCLRRGTGQETLGIHRKNTRRLWIITDV